MEAEELLQKTPPLLKTPSGYVQQSPWLSIANKQLEIMGRYMAELGLPPSSRGRITLAEDQTPPVVVIRKVVYEGRDAPVEHEQHRALLPPAKGNDPALQ